MSQVPETSQEIDSTVPDYLLARNGIALLLNNRHSEAEQLFLQHSDSLTMFAGYSITCFMDALMSFEEDKLNAAINTLKEVEKRCSGTSWFNKSSNKSLEVQLETQIIYADSQVCIAILTFLQQDLSGYFKGGWVLRKAWKVYQRTYKDILRLYKRNVGELSLPGNDTSSCVGSLSSSAEKLRHSQSIDALSTESRGGELRKSVTMNFKMNFDSLLSSFNSFHDRFVGKEENVEKESIVRLMGAISFGYGLFQLGISLLPPSIMKLINLLGFSASRESGVACLMYAREGSDMRAPLATLSLLWYHTIVRPFYAIDGTHIDAGVQISLNLLHCAESDFPHSALFLFFKGRIHRLQSDMQGALCAFESSVKNSEQREIRILALHEVAWCHLIELEYELAEKRLLELRQLSRWSQPFYIYLAAICCGCLNLRRNSKAIFNELKQAIDGGLRMNGPLNEFLTRRSKLIDFERPSIFFKLLLYEMLYLWNALPSCSFANLKKIVEECGKIEGNDDAREPMLGLANLIAGCAYVVGGRSEMAVREFRRCLAERNRAEESNLGIIEDAHVSAFALCELADVMLKTQQNPEECRELLQRIGSRYSHYDFETRLNVRIHALLKHL